MAIPLNVFLKPYFTEIQNIEDLLFELHKLKDIDTVTSVHLTRLCNLIGQERGGFSDDELRVWGKARILVNKSTGTPEELFTIIRQIKDDPTYKIDRYREYYPKYFEIDIFDLQDPVTYVGILKDSRAAGIGAGFNTSIYPSGELLTLSASDGTDLNTGLADSLESYGGHLTAFYTI